MKILVVMRKEFAGCGFYRMYQPHNHLAKNYQTQVLLTNGLKQFTDEQLKQYDIVIWHRSYFSYEDIDRAKSLGIVTVGDFDDHWITPREHIFYKAHQKDQLASKLHRFMLKVDHVTCTTELLADEIYKHNQNVTVLPNSMDMNYEGCKVDRVKEDMFVFGYLGGHTHLRDVLQLEGLQKEMTLTEKGYNFRLFGFDKTEVYTKYADILSDRKRSQNYSIYKGADIWHYPQFYNYMDCSLVPLENSFFNSMKSELKLIEAGFFKKAVIVSNVEPYSRLSKFCLHVNQKSDWLKHCRSLLHEKNLAQDLGEQLYTEVQEYSIENVNKKRYKLYRNVLKNKHMDSSGEPGRMVKFVECAV